jgi:hypothetical protein
LTIGRIMSACMREKERNLNEEEKFLMNPWWVSELKDKDNCNLLKARYIVSFRHMEKSNFPSLVEELKDKSRGGIISFPKVSREASEKDIEKGVKIILAWNPRKVIVPFFHRNMLTYNSLEVGFNFDGRIKVKGGMFGSANLSSEQWYNNFELQKKTLEKAYRHPRKSYYNPEFDILPKPIGEHLFKSTFR